MNLRQTTFCTIITFNKILEKVYLYCFIHEYHQYSFCHRCNHTVEMNLIFLLYITIIGSVMEFGITQEDTAFEKVVHKMDLHEESSGYESLPEPEFIPTYYWSRVKEKNKTPLAEPPTTQTPETTTNHLDECKCKKTCEFSTVFLIFSCLLLFLNAICLAYIAYKYGLIQN